MKLSQLLVITICLYFTPFGARAEEPAAEPAASLTIDHKQKTVEVVPATKEKYPYMRVRLPRKDNRPLELRLHVIEPDQSPLRYRGTFHEWDGNMAGVQVEVSFDKKTWRRLKSLVK